MKILKFKNIEYSEVLLSELDNDLRCDAEYFLPTYQRFEQFFKNKEVSQVESFAFVTDGIHASIDFDENSKINLISAKAPKENDFDLSATSYISAKQHKYNPRTALQIDDVVITTVGTIGNCAVVNENILPANSDRHVGIIRIRQSKIYPRYLSTYFLCKYGRAFVKREIAGNVQPNLYIKNIKKLKIPTPSVSFQKKIENLVLESYEQKKLSKSLYKEAEQILLQALGLENWQPEKRKYYIKGVEFETIDSISEANLSEMFSSERLDSEFWQPFYEDAEKVLTKGDYVELGHYTTARLQKGNQARTDDFGKFPYASIKDCNNLEINTTEKGDGQRAVFADPESLVLAITGATIGKVAMNITNETIAISGDLVNIESVGDLSNAYLLTVLNSPMIQALCKRFTTGATNGHLSVSNVAKFPIPIIDGQKQIEIENRIKTMFLNRQRSKFLLEQAKRAVEIYIEKDEGEAEKYLVEME